MNNEEGSRETVVVTTEEELILSDVRMAAFEKRLTDVVQKPHFAMFVVLAILFVQQVAVTIFITNLNDTVDNTDKILVEATGEEAKAAQNKVVEDLLFKMNCQDQENLQHLMDNIVQLGLKQFQELPTIVDQACEMEEVPNG